MIIIIIFYANLREIRVNYFDLKVNDNYYRLLFFFLTK